MKNKTKVISFMNSKGGQGKTMTTFQVALILDMLGYKVLLIDIGKSGTLTKVLNKEGNIIKDYIHEYFKNPNQYHDLINSLRDGLDYIANNPKGTLSAINNIISLPDRENKTFLKNLISTLRDKYDFILIDGPSCCVSHGELYYDILSENVLNASDYVIITIKPDYFAVDALKYTIKNIMDKSYHQFNPDLELLGVFLSKYVKGEEESKYVINQINQAIPPGKMFNTKIRNSKALEKSMQLGKTKIDYKRGSAGARDYIDLTEEILRRLKIILEEFKIPPTVFDIPRQNDQQEYTEKISQPDSNLTKGFAKDYTN